MKRIALALGFSVLLAVVPAHAEPARDPAAAEILFEKGRTALGRGDVDAACAFFAESLRLDPGAGTLFNLATCEERQGKIASAWQHLREGIAQLPADDPRQKPAEAHARELAPRIPRLALRLPANVAPGARVYRDDVELSSVSLGLALPLNPGKHRIVATAPGHEPSEAVIVIAEGENKAIVVALGALQPAPARVPTATKPGADAGTLRVVGFVAAGVGIAGLATGALAGGVATVQASTVRSACDVDTRVCSRSGLDALDTTKTWGSISTASLIAGGALVVAGLVVALVVPKRSAVSPASAAGSVSFLTF